MFKENLQQNKFNSFLHCLGHYKFYSYYDMPCIFLPHLEQILISIAGMVDYLMDIYHNCYLLNNQLKFFGQLSIIYSSHIAFSHNCKGIKANFNTICIRYRYIYYSEACKVCKHFFECLCSADMGIKMSCNRFEK